MTRPVVSSLSALFAAILFFSSSPAAPGEGPSLIPNGGMEQIENDWPLHWRKLWLREAGAGSAVVDTATRHSGSHAIRVEHRGKEDWSLEPEGERLGVAFGDVYVLSAWVKTQDAHLVQLGGDLAAVLALQLTVQQGHFRRAQPARQKDEKRQAGGGHHRHHG